MDTEVPLHVADWERDGWHIWDGSSYDTVPRDALLRGDSLPPAGSILVIEAAHLSPRTPRSVAQVYAQDELEKLAAVAAGHGVAIKAFPAKVSPKARQHLSVALGEEVGKDRDPEAIRDFLVSRPGFPLMAWPRSPERVELDKFLNEQRDDMTSRLNMMRPDYDSPEVIRADYILRSAYPVMSPNLRRWAVEKVVFKGTSRERIDFRHTFAMSIYVAVFNSDGTLRPDPNTGQPVGIRWIWRLLKLHAFHDKAGTARSNLMWWVYRPAVNEKKNGVQLHERAGFNRAIRELVHLFREYGV